MSHPCRAHDILSNNVPVPGVALVVFLSSLGFLVHRSSRSAPAWGAAWGIVFGFLLIGPRLLDVHHLRPATFAEWIAVAAFVAAVSAMLGGLLGFVSAIGLAARAVVLKRDLRNPIWGSAVWVAATLPPLYLALSVWIESTQLHALPDLRRYYAALGLGTLAVLHLTFVAILATAYVRWAAAGRDSRGWKLAAALGCVALAGALALPSRIGSGSPRAGAVAPPLVETTRRPAAPLLVIGLDGGTWRVLRPLMMQGAAPTFARLAADGIQGRTTALWPPYWSAPAWAAIVTGHNPGDNDVHEDLSAAAPGAPIFELPLAFNPALNPVFAVEYVLIGLHIIEPMPTPRTRLSWPPVWERLSRAGIRTAVLRFPFTYPAAGQAHYVVSNRIVTDLWGPLGVRPGRHGALTEPVADEEEWIARLAEEPGDPALARRVLPRLDWPKPADAVENPISVLKQVLLNRQQMNEGAKRLVERDPRIAAMMIHVASFDEICHAFWQYRFPEDFPDAPPARADVEQLGPVVDRFVELLDRQLAELIAAFPIRPNVVIAADHGEGPVTTFKTIWRGEHAPDAMFLAAGPDVPHHAEMIDVSYYDVVPTILDIERFRKPADLVGTSVLETANAGQ
jgi:type I phosphodiesterase/nucleotide pyrophosphatase